MPNNWAITSFEEIVELISGRDLETSSCNDIKEGIPYLIGASNIVKRSLFITRWTTKPIVISQKNDILISCKGTIGEVIRNTIGDIHIARQFMALRNNSIVDTNYIELYIRAILKRIKSDARGVIPGISREDILCRDILLPPLNEQKRIVLEASKLISIIEKINVDKNELVKAIAAYKLTILQLAITGKLVPQDLSDEPAIDLLRRINPNYKPCDNRHYANVPFDLPKTWQLTKLKDLCVFLSRGKSPKYSETDKTYPVFAQKCNLKDGGISLEQARFLDPTTVSKWKDVYKLQDGDILINSTGTGTVCRTRLFKTRYLNNYPFVVPDSHVSVIRLHKLISPEYAYIVLSSNASQSYMMDNLAGSTNQKELYISVLENLIFPVPPIEEQRRIVYIVKKISEYIDKIAAAL